MNKQEVIGLLQATGLDIRNFDNIPDGEMGLPVLHVTKINASKTLPFLFSDDADLTVCGGRGMKNNVIIFTLEYSYKHFGGSNGKSIVVRSDDGGENFYIS